MDNYIFIPDNKCLFTLNGVRKGVIHYKFNNSQYQTLNYYKTPDENIIENCIIVITNLKIAVGLEYDKKSGYAPFLIFKSFNPNKIKAICKKFRVKIYFHNKLAKELFINCSINQEIPTSLFKAIATLFSVIIKKDKIFAKKLGYKI